jgi:hypothetical protein
LQTLEENASQNGTPLCQGVRKPQLILACKASKSYLALETFPSSGCSILTLMLVKRLSLQWQEHFLSIYCLPPNWWKCSVGRWCIATRRQNVVPHRLPPSNKAAAAAAPSTAATRHHLGSCCVVHRPPPVQRHCRSAIVTVISSSLCLHSSLCLLPPANAATATRVAHCHRSRCCLYVATVIVAAISSTHSAHSNRSCCSTCSRRSCRPLPLPLPR